MGPIKDDWFSRGCDADRMVEPAMLSARLMRRSICPAIPDCAAHHATSPPVSVIIPDQALGDSPVDGRICDSPSNAGIRELQALQARRLVNGHAIVFFAAAIEGLLENLRLSAYPLIRLSAYPLFLRWVNAFDGRIAVVFGSAPVAGCRTGSNTDESYAVVLHGVSASDLTDRCFSFGSGAGRAPLSAPAPSEWKCLVSLGYFRIQMSNVITNAKRLQGALIRQTLDDGGCVGDPSLEQYVEACGQHDLAIDCNGVPHSQRSLYESILAKRGRAKALVYNQIALLCLIENRLESDEFSLLPAAVCKELEGWVAQVCRDIKDKPADYYDIFQKSGQQRADLMKDFAVCSGRAIPVGGAWIVEKRRLRGADLFDETGENFEPDSGPAKTPSRELAKRMARAMGILNPLKSLRTQWRELRGQYNNYFVIHTSHRYRRYFSERYLNRAYCNTAALLDRNTDVVGLYRRSWFLDPKVIEMEPRLNFLLRVPVAHGAIHHPVMKVAGKDIANILDNSRDRRAAYASGEYQPWEWGFLWPRSELQEWAGSSCRSD